MNVPRRLGLILMITMLLLFSMRFLRSTDEASVFDIPKKLQEEKTSLVVRPYGIADGALVFSTTQSGGEDDRLYLQPATQFLDIQSKDFQRLKDSGFTIKIFGSFYKGKGIPERYLGIKPKPAKYNVFRYESMETVKE